MKIKIKYRNYVLVLSSIICLIFFLVRCINKPDNTKPDEETTKFDDYTSVQKCAGCHKDIYDKHLKSAHYLTGQPAKEEFIKGSFQQGKNTYSYTPAILLSMEKRDSGFYQVAYFKGEEKKAMRFDMVIGSGVMGQSFLNWRGNRLYQLPITYFTAANQWANSPGFPHDRVLIDRPVTSRCLECHTSYAQGISGDLMEPAEFDKNNIIYGVDCQKCHGPAAKHAEFQTAHPEEKTAKYIINPAKLSRLQQLDVCAVCHGGNIQKTKPSFEFTAGKKLADYFTINPADDIVVNGTSIDVHGNQLALLKSSKCFRNTETMTCNTCHNTHENERGKVEVFSQRCMSCHKITDEKFKTKSHLQINVVEKNCIDCHMPSQTSKSIAVFLQGQETPIASKLRSHLIAIYPDKK